MLYVNLKICVVDDLIRSCERLIRLVKGNSSKAPLDTNIDTFVFLWRYNQALTNELITAEARNNCTVMFNIVTVGEDVAYTVSLPNMLLLIAC